MPTRSTPDVPPALRAWIDRVVSPEAVVAPSAGTDGRVQTWRVEAPGRVAFCRWGRATRKHAQELRAAQEVWPSLAGAPNLIAAEAAHGALLMTACPGSPSTLPEATRALGALLATLHALPCDDADPLPLTDALGRRFDAAARAIPDPLRPLRRAAEGAFSAGRSALAARRRWCHRDVQPANWLWDGGRVHLVDWEHARLDAPLLDLARLAGTPHLSSAKAGYGPIDSDGLRAAVALDGLATVAWALRHGDRALLSTGMARLRAL